MHKVKLKTMQLQRLIADWEFYPIYTLIPEITTVYKYLVQDLLRRKKYQDDFKIS